MTTMTEPESMTSIELMTALGHIYGFEVRGGAGQDMVGASIGMLRQGGVRARLDMARLGRAKRGF